tara:strand:- start:2234 stop:2560 length:327 start_codon:yes stop_codon:yes gene_type:complete
MGIFGFGKNKDVVDLGEHYRKKQERASEIKEEENIDSSVTPFPFFADAGSTEAQGGSSETDTVTSPIDPSERRRRLVRRLKDMTDRLEDLSNQIYKLQQRVEVLERKG